MPNTPSEPLRVLVVDDSPAMRSTIVNVLSAEPGIRVVGTAGDGQAAIDAVETLAPDVVTLDIEMPRIDGHSFLRIVRPRHPRLPIIVFSHLTQRGAIATIDALFLGATDYVGKPTRPENADAARYYVKTELVQKILAFRTGAEPPRIEPRPERPRRPPAPQIVVVGSSTGGPAAIDEIIRALPRTFSLPVVIVQHMPPAFVPLLADRISARSSIPVAEARHGDVVGPGKVLLAPGDRHLLFYREGPVVKVALDGGPAVNGCRPSVDTLFKSAARAYGAGALGVVLTGMGQEGLEGSQQIVLSGGRVLVQDEASSVVWGMPGRVVKAGLADAVVPLKEIAGELALRVRQAVARSAGGFPP